MRTLILFILSLFLLGGCSFNSGDTPPYNNIKYPRFSPDSKQLVFDIANASFPERGRIYLYSLESKQLSTYIAPHGQCFEMASFSDDGKKLVFITEPIGDRNISIDQQRNEILLNDQVATMNVDGSDMQVLTSDKSLKQFPAFSHKGDKVLFAMSTHLGAPGHIIASKLDLYEMDIESKEVNLFMGQKFNFFEMGYSTYFNDDETVLLDAGTPRDNLPIEIDWRDFSKKTNNSSVYKVKRGQAELSMPMLMEFSFSTLATMDRDENIYFEGTSQKEGSKIMKFGINGAFTKWSFPLKKSGTTMGMSVSKDGKYVAYSFTSDNSQLMFLDTHTGIWSEIVLPQTAKEIQVQ